MTGSALGASLRVPICAARLKAINDAKTATRFPGIIAFLARDVITYAAIVIIIEIISNPNSVDLRLLGDVKRRARLHHDVPGAFVAIRLLVLIKSHSFFGKSI